ncbi:MAG: hypothetical protein AAFP03_08780 [Cyanobacteria bacterium J06598_3]
MSSSSASGRSFGAPSRSRRTASRQTAQGLSRSGATLPRTQSSTNKSVLRKQARKPSSQKPSSQKPLRAPRLVRKLVRWLVLGPKKSPRKVLMAGGSVATLAALVIVPTRVGSQQVALSSCQEVVQSGAEISRAQVESLLAVPEGSRREAVRQVIDVPYCLLPSRKDNAKPGEQASEQAGEQASENASQNASDQPGDQAGDQVGGNASASAPAVIEREAYPLAFDPQAWVVVRYAGGEYAGYDFVFKP